MHVCYVSDDSDIGYVKRMYVMLVMLVMKAM